MNSKKHERFLRTAQAIADIWSKDPSTKVGCVAVGSAPNQVAWGYNGFPPGVADTPERLQDRATKYRLTVHAEVNALANASFDVHTLYLTHPPCQACSLHILSARTVRHVIFIHNQDPAFVERWHASLAESRALLAEGGIALDALAI